MNSSKSMAQLAVLTLAFLMVVGSTSLAQERGERRGRRGGFDLSAISLAAREQVQNELAVTNEQKTGIERVSASYREKAAELYTGLRDLSREEREQKFRERAAEREQLAADAEKQLAEVLNETQLKRLNEILIQVLGGRALLREDVAKALALSGEQQAKIKEVLDSEREKTRQLFAELREGRIQRDGFREKMTAVRDEIQAQAVAVLSPEQTTQLEQLKGKPFELERRGSGRRS